MRAVIFTTLSMSRFRRVENVEHVGGAVIGDAGTMQNTAIEKI